MSKTDKNTSSFLEKLCHKARQLGALEAVAIDASDIVLDDRALLKCLVPMCANYGVNLTCPPNSISSTDFKRILNKYHSAILIRIGNIPSCKSEEIKRQNNLSEIWKMNKAAGNESGPANCVTDYLQVLRQG